MFVATKGFSLVTQTVEKQLPSLQEGNKPTMVATWWRGPAPLRVFCMGDLSFVCSFKNGTGTPQFFEGMMIHYNKVCCSKIDHFLFEHVDIYIYTRTVQLLLLLLVCSTGSCSKRCRSLIHVQTWKVDEPPLQPNTKKHSSNRTTWKSRAFLHGNTCRIKWKRSNLFSL